MSTSINKGSTTFTFDPMQPQEFISRRRKWEMKSRWLLLSVLERAGRMMARRSLDELLLSCYEEDWLKTGGRYWKIAQRRL
jgi:hypothetical protein